MQPISHKRLWGILLPVLGIAPCLASIGINQCGVYSGNLYLTGNITTQAPSPCITLSGNQTILDIRGYSINGVQEMGALNGLLRIVGPIVGVYSSTSQGSITVGGVSAYQIPIAIVGNSNFTSIGNIRWGGGMLRTDIDGGCSSNLRITNNGTTANPTEPMQISCGTGHWVQNNVMLAINAAGTYAGVVTFVKSADNARISGNNIHGGHIFGATDRNGADDGVTLGAGCVGCLIYNNNIDNVWDAPIEPIGLVQNAHFYNNTMSKFQIACIGAYYNTSWYNVEVDHNTCELDKLPNGHYPYWLEIISLDSGPPTVYYFQGVNVHDNTVTSNDPDMTYAYILTINQVMPTGSTLVYGFNSFGNNALAYPTSGFDFGNFTPSDIFSDTGFNYCKIAWSDGGNPIHCNAP